MDKRYNNLNKTILDKVFDGAKKSFDFSMEFKSGNDSVNASFEDYFEDTFARIQLMGNKSESKGFAGAEAFALNAFNVVAHTRELHKQIDDYFANEVNQTLLDAYGMNEEEKTAYRKELKEKVSDSIGFKGNTPEENAFIDKINAAFDMNQGNSNADYLKETLNYLSNVSRYIENGASQKDALTTAFNDASFTGANIDIATVLSSEISILADSLGKDEKKNDLYMKDISANYVDEIDNREVSPESFSYSYEKNPQNLTKDEKAWAQKAFGRIIFNTMDMESGWDVFNMDLTNFRANGEQIISDEEFQNAKNQTGALNPEKMEEFQEKIVAKMASGAEISVIDRTPEKAVNINLAEIKAKTPAEKFLFGYPDSLTAADKQWAQDVTANLINYNGGMVEVNRFYADGKQIIPNDENSKNLSFEDCSRLIAQKIASGAEIAVRVSAFNQELELMTMDAQDMAAINPEKAPVTLESFAAHFKADPNNLTPEEKEWAREAYDKMFLSSMDLSNGWDPSTVNIQAFCANGQRIISDEELAKTGPEDVDNLKAKIAFSLASGDKVTVRREIEEKSVSFDLSSVKVSHEIDKEQAEPTKDEPAKTEPAKTEPAKTEPAKTEPTKTEPTKTEPAKTEPAKTEPAKTERAKVIRFKTDPAKTDPSKKQPAKIPAKNISRKNINARMLRLKKQMLQRQRIAANMAKVQNAVKNAQKNASINAQRNAQKNSAKTTINQKPSFIENFMRKILVSLVKGFLGIDLDEVINKQKEAEKSADKTDEKKKTESSRTKTDFNELMKKEAEASGKKLPTEKTFAKTNEKVNEKTNEKTLTQKGLAK